MLSLTGTLLVSLQSDVGTRVKKIYLEMKVLSVVINCVEYIGIHVVTIEGTLYRW